MLLWYVNDMNIIFWNLHKKNLNKLEFNNQAYSHRK